jgi:hypothetical protein
MLKKGVNLTEKRNGKALLLTRRFAAMAGVARRTIIAELHRYSLVASVLRPATAASRWDVKRKFLAKIHR